jgi:putative nucleotidyltransferase with HDIG domain
VKLVEMSDYGRAAKLYWRVMVAAGTLVALWAFYQSLSFTPVEWACFIALLSIIIITGCFPIRLPGTTASVTAGDSFIFLSVLLLGVPAGVLLGAVDSFVCSCSTTRRWATRFCAPAIMAVTTLVAGSAFYEALAIFAAVRKVPIHIGALRVEQLLVPLAFMTLLQYFLNGSLLAIMYSLRNKSSIRRFWREGYLLTALTYVTAAICVALIYGAISRFGFVYVLLSGTVLAATYASYRIYFERLNTKTLEASEMSRLHLATVEALATAIDAKDQTTHCHVRRVQLYAAGMGRVFGLSDNEIEALRAGALLHDVGKLAVPDHILNKPGRLTSAEFERMKVHTIVGAEILSRVEFPYPVVPIVRHHHEQWNGLGYPDRLKGEEIPLTARILAVVDCFDSVREDRPFRRGMTRDEAIALLWRGSGAHFDPKVVELFVEHLPRFEEEITALGLDQQRGTDETEAHALTEADIAHISLRGRDAAMLAYDQIKNAHREVYALYEIARTFGSSLDIEDTVSILVNKVGHVVPFDTFVAQYRRYRLDSRQQGGPCRALRYLCRLYLRRAESLCHSRARRGQECSGFRESLCRTGRRRDGLCARQSPLDQSHQSQARLPRATATFGQRVSRDGRAPPRQR